VPPFYFFTRLDGEPDLSLALVEPPAQQMQAPLVDWDSLRIEDNRDEEGRIEIVDDEVMYELLGFRADDEERTVVHDPNRPNMDLGTVYSNMKEFRLAVRQFAINKEFELHVVKTDPERYIGGCKGGEDCPWHLVGRRQPDGCTVMVLTFILRSINFFPSIILRLPMFFALLY